MMSSFSQEPDDILIRDDESNSSARDHNSMFQLTQPTPTPRKQRMRRNSRVPLQQPPSEQVPADNAFADLEALLEGGGQSEPAPTSQAASVGSSPSTLSNASSSTSPPLGVPANKRPSDDDPPPQVKRRVFQASLPPKKKTTPLVAKNSHSIVGSRPKHWGQSRDVVVPTRYQITNRQQRQAALTAELHRAPKLTRSIGSTTTSFAPRALVPKASHHSNDPAPQSPLPEEAFPALTRVPRQEFVVQNRDNHAVRKTVFSPRGSSTKKAQNSVLSKKLQMIRDRITGDCLRLQSGQYPYAEHARNPNDPRNRAETFCDVTILDIHVETSKNPLHVRTLAHIHNWNNEHDSASRAWILFTHETAKYLCLSKQLHVRIYNAIRIPHHEHPKVKWIVLCTKLCEPYPESLPPLPDVSPE